MELAQEMLGLEALGKVRGKVCQQARLGRGQVENHGGLIRRLHGHRLATHGHIVLGLFKDVGVQHQVVMPELHVRAGERRAVRPLVALAQIEGQLGEIVVPFPGLGNVRHDGLQVIRIAHQVHVAHRKEVRRSRLRGVRQHIQRAAILTDAGIGHDDQGLFRQTLGQGWQIAIALDLGVQRLDIGVGGKFHGATRGILELDQVILLRIGARGDAAHILERDRGAVGVGVGRHRQHHKGYA